jgi:hypothetical protein
VAPSRDVEFSGGLTAMTVQYRILGRTGVSVSPLCLGTMMFGPWGNKDEADCIRVIHRALAPWSSWNPSCPPPMSP